MSSRVVRIAAASVLVGAGVGLAVYTSLCRALERAWDRW